jgi:uncharacterized membrane protein
MPQIKQNYTIGVRLPWTLESEKAWDASHAFVGRAWISVGLTTAGLAAIPESVLELGGAPVALLLGGLAVSTAAAVVIAYRAWRDDTRSTRPKRRTARTRSSARK